MNWQEIILGVIGGGGFATVITALATRKKNTSDIQQSNIDTALKLKSEALKEYMTAREELSEARRLIANAEERIRLANAYIKVLQDLLDENGIKYPPREAINEEIKNQ